MESEEFDELHFQGLCRLRIGGESATVTVTSWSPTYSFPSKWVARDGIPISLGDAYGVLSKTHSLSLYVPCTFESKTQRMMVSASSSLTEIDTSIDPAPSRIKPVEGDDKMAAFTAIVTREITRDWLKCPNADKLPEGPVKIHWP